MSFTTTFPILHTEDLPRLVAFYTGPMGLPMTYRFPFEGEPEFVTVGVGDSTIGLQHYRDIERVLGPIARAGSPYQLCLYTDDLDGDLARLRRAGARIHTEPVVKPWKERMCYVADPDGNLLMLAEPTPEPPLATRRHR